MSGRGKRCLADEELRMLYSHSWWKRCEQIITKTAGRSWVRVCRQASTLCTHPAANDDAALAGSWLVWLKNRWCVVGEIAASLATDAPFCRRGREHAAARRADGSGPAVTDECSHRGVGDHDAGANRGCQDARERRVLGPRTWGVRRLAQERQHHLGLASEYGALARRRPAKLSAGGTTVLRMAR
jgi:hypothetical protein